MISFKSNTLDITVSKDTADINDINSNGSELGLSDNFVVTQRSVEITVAPREDFALRNAKYSGFDPFQVDQIEVDVDEMGDEEVLVVEIDGVYQFSAKAIETHRNKGNRKRNRGRLKAKFNLKNRLNFRRAIRAWVVKRIGEFAVETLDSKIKVKDAETWITYHEPTNTAGRVLILTHGIFSNSDAAFKGILSNDEYFDKLKPFYPGGIYPWDHYTISKSPLQNAKDLSRKLRDFKRTRNPIDLIAHSRGCAIQRCLLEHPDLVQEIQGLNFGNAMFVAGANHGSRWADIERITDFLTLAANVISEVPKIGKAIEFFIDLLIDLAKFAERQPGIYSMHPESDIYKSLIDSNVAKMSGYTYMAANYDVKDNLSIPNGIDELCDRVFDGAANDLIIPFDGAVNFDKYEANGIPRVKGLNNGHYYFGSLTETQEQIKHTNFFYDNRVQEQILLFAQADVDLA